MNKLCYLSVLLLTSLVMPFASFAHCDGVKHSGNHPHCGGEEPPPPPPANCTGVAGFPGFAYSKEVIGGEVIGGKRGTDPGRDLYLSSTDASCSVMILSNRKDIGWIMRYRQNGSQGRIIWALSEEPGLKRHSADRGKPVLYLATFTVIDGVVSDFALSIAYRHLVGDYVGMGGVDLSPDGNIGYFAFTEPGGHSLNLIDLTSCTPECEPDIKPFIIVASTDNYGDLAMNTSGTRLYVARQNYGVGFLDLATSSFRYVSLPSDFSSFRTFAYVSVGQLASGNEAIAVSYDDHDLGTTDIIDVGNCAANGSSSSCLATGESTMHISGITGGTPTSFLGLDLMDNRDGNINLFDIGTLGSTIIVEGGKSADSAE